MNIHELEKLLIDSLRDFKLDNDEKEKFKELSEDLSEDKIRFIKNKAFDLGRPLIEKGGTDSVRVLNWIERVTKAIQPISNTMPIKSSAYFSPGHTCRDNIIRLIKQAKHTLNICVFTISDNKITEAILAAYKRGINLTIISDNDKSNDKGSDIHYLTGQGLNVILDHSRHHMHHKYMLVDDKILLNGSFNWTRSASDFNEENITITMDIELVRLFAHEFSQLKRQLTDLDK